MVLQQMIDAFVKLRSKWIFPDCDFVAHVNCGIKYRQSNTESDEDERSITMNDEFIESSFDIIREIKHGDERIIAEIKHFSHQHNLILSDEFSNDLKCDGLDVRCFVSTKDSIEHSGHEHPLYLAVESENRHCSGCGVSAEYGTFRCVDCDFNLDFKCATLPDKARHRYDKHPLFLTYIDPNDYQYVCQICEKERDPKLWFYRCEKCDFDANPECVLGKYPFIKLGDSYIFDNQPSPLSFWLKK
ncbi:hypothetical protein OIU85_000455 [Salix viminalis]|uniref:DC1 domain-containing protein n=1 Tax=Salix viminalis TaxID=40686 RepID=A0A9Q0VJ82_SALVM|nr:hypothetical protein OIU85_000455 [Salix viminalis]